MVDASAAASLKLLLLGETSDPEMAPIARHLSGLAGIEIRVIGNTDRVCELISANGWHPDLIVALQTWSDQFPATDVLKLLSVTPLARTVCAAGSWFDSDSRSRSSWPIAARIRGIDALARIDHEVAGLRHATVKTNETRAPRPVILPLTASRAEVFEADMARPPLPRIDGSRITVHSPDRAWLRMIESALGSSSSEERLTPPAIVVVDVDPWVESQQELLRAAKTNGGATRVIACTGVAAPDFGDELKRGGADAVWFKLSPLASLKQLCGKRCEQPA